MPTAPRKRGDEGEPRSRFGPERRLLAALFAAAAVLHFYHLDEPRSVVFDEVYFGAFVDAYTSTGKRFFDVHPPHGKLLAAAAVALSGYEGGQSFETIHTPMEQMSPFALRFVPALAGSLLPAVICLVLLQLGASRPAAALGGMAVLLDNALLVQTRIVALDGILLLATFGALSAILAALEREPGRRRTALVALAGALSGLAVGTKFTGGVAGAMVVLCLGADVLRTKRLDRWRPAAIELGCMGLVACLVYLGGWALHFALLSQPGPGDLWGKPTGAFFTDLIHVHRQMLSANVGLAKTHDYASPWWSWPFMARPVFYWKDPRAAVYFLGNPVLWWGAAFGVVVLAGQTLLLRVSNLELVPRDPERERRIWIPVVGYAIALLPLAFVPRVLFLYHYLMPLLFAVCAIVLALDRIGWTRPGGLHAQRVSYHATAGLLALGFLATTPFTYSWIMAPEYQNWVFGLLPGWR